MDWNTTDPYTSCLEDLIYRDTSDLEKSNIVPIWITLVAITLGYKWTNRGTTAEELLESLSYYNEIKEQFYA